MTTLYQKAQEIISESINSAIFIDEQALEPFSDDSSSSIPEEILSKSLYKSFKKMGVALDIYKFKANDLAKINEDEINNYLFKNRDLVLLDWKLNGSNGGEEYSLKLLSNIVKEKHIQFCSIYTSELNFDLILQNILCYFSGHDSKFYENISEELDIEYSDNKSIFELIDYTDLKNNENLILRFEEIDQNLPNVIKRITRTSNFGKALVQVKYAFSNFHKSNSVNSEPTHINNNTYSLNINNTIVTLISKSENNPKKIINKLSKQIKNSENCFSQLLGLDMQNTFNSSSSFLDNNLLNVSMDALMFHRNQMCKNGVNTEFNDFVRSILIEQSLLTLENAELKILNPTFLDKISKNKYYKIDNDLATLNTFYNGAIIKNKKHLNFGDIFHDKISNLYYLCITPLCDCYHPENIKHNFFFVKGTLSKNIKDCIKLNDGGFKSFIGENKCILWANKQGLYIKPVHLHVSNTEINSDSLSVQYHKNANPNTSDLKYVFSLKQNYCQRIANHTFNYPLRVGVDFVNKE